jgi:hypothetical protein
MIKLWRKVIRPIIDAAGAKSIMEIGAEAGTSTKVLLRYVREKNGHLYCIDPVPDFDYEEFKSNNKDVLTFYKDLSLNVLPCHQRFDVAMIDGDHNWYTVYNELRQIEKIHDYDPLAQPIMFIHDIGWPYGRRDLYYNPDNIPEEFHQPHERKGMLPKRSELVEGNGMNLELWNACHEGGARNGVLTGVEDFLNESSLEYEFIRLPLYYGLGILITRERLIESKNLQAVIDQMRTAAGYRELVEVAEHLRIVDGVMMQAISRKLRGAEQRIEQLENELSKASDRGDKA